MMVLGEALCGWILLRPTIFELMEEAFPSPKETELIRLGVYSWHEKKNTIF